MYDAFKVDTKQLNEVKPSSEILAPGSQNVDGVSTQVWHGFEVIKPRYLNKMKRFPMTARLLALAAIIFTAMLWFPSPQNGWPGECSLQFPSRLFAPAMREPEASIGHTPRVVALVFYGRKEYVSILNCYLQVWLFFHCWVSIIVNLTIAPPVAKPEGKRRAFGRGIVRG